MPLEMLMKAKMEQKIRDEMIKAGTLVSENDMANINLATTQNTTS